MPEEIALLTITTFFSTARFHAPAARAMCPNNSFELTLGSAEFRIIVESLTNVTVLTNEHPIVLDQIVAGYRAAVMPNVFAWLADVEIFSPIKSIARTNIRAPTLNAGNRFDVRIFHFSKRTES
jgi:hypothetical protein